MLAFLDVIDVSQHRPPLASGRVAVQPLSVCTAPENAMGLLQTHECASEIGVAREAGVGDRQDRAEDIGMKCKQI